MGSKRINVLVYAGTGSTVESVRHCLYSLRRLLSPNYAVHTVTGDTIIKEPWLASCALLVFPGGADLGYCRTLNGEGNRRIKQYVNSGGSYLGLCAGGYYGSRRCEFEVGHEDLEVVGSRELGFFPGTCRGSAFSGFVYNSESGARAAELVVEKSSFGSSDGVLPEGFRCYFNGGSVFVDAEKYEERDVQVLARFAQPLDVDPGDGGAAAVYCKVGEGNVVLTGSHPEFAAINLSKKAKGMDPAVVDALAEDDKPRKDFLKACLTKLCLDINESEGDPPSLSRIHLSAFGTADLSPIIGALQEIVETVDGEDYIRGENDTFHLEKPASTWSMSKLAKAVSDLIPIPGSNGEPDSEGDSSTAMDYNKVMKKLVTHEEPPSAKSTPYFNHQSYFSNWKAYNALEDDSADGRPTFGRYIMYGEVVTSTSTMLEKNTTLTNILPTGTTMTATIQLSARGRGSNAWVAPTGALMFTTVLRHPLNLNATAPVVFIQYLAALAVAEGVQTYSSTDSPSFSLHKERTSSSPRQISPYRAVPIKLKWPNDIYALDPSKSSADPSDRTAYTKIGGVLVNSSYGGGDYTLVIGIGLNVSNAAPTTSLNAVLEAINNDRSSNTTAATQKLPPFTIEKLLARILTTLEKLYEHFKRNGFAGDIEELYYRHWLHKDQIVTLETEGDARAKIRGITRDWGMLLAEELVDDRLGNDRPTGRKFALQTDSNSFDFFKGLLKRKL